MSQPFVASVGEIGTLAQDHMPFLFEKISTLLAKQDFQRLPGGSLLLQLKEAHPMANVSVNPSGEDVGLAATTLAEANYPSMMLIAGAVEPEAASLLEAHGFQAPPPMPAMAVDIDVLPDTPLQDGFVFERLTASSDAAAWREACASAFELPQRLASILSPEQVPVDESPDAAFQFFQVSKDGEIAGISMMMCGLGLAGIYSVGTVEKFRRMGVGAAVTARPLQLAKQLGYKVGILQASEAGLPVYRRLGFVDAGSIPFFVRMPES